MTELKGVSCKNESLVSLRGAPVMPILQRPNDDENVDDFLCTYYNVEVEYVPRWRYYKQ